VVFWVWIGRIGGVGRTRFFAAGQASHLPCRVILCRIPSFLQFCTVRMAYRIHARSLYLRPVCLCKARKDNGSIITVSSYSLTNWVLWNPDNENAIMEIEDLSRQISALDDKRDALRKSLVVKTLKDVLNEMKAQG